MEIVSRKAPKDEDVKTFKLNYMEIIEGQEPKTEQLGNKPVAPMNQRLKETLTVGQWVLTLFLMFIPLVNIIMPFVWAFGGNKDERENWAKATLIWWLIGIVVFACIVSCVGFATLCAFAAADRK
ncbi:MAG TPA: hypothetical protein PK500_05565 [Candidatus Egerieousia sp.]|nr:hypothetical protein [Candidatus Egerieousia sp.]HPT06101.1 hypothetical protein [Candidatus Egerieousia sp.]